VLTPQTTGRTNEENIDEDVDESSSPPILLSRRGILPAEEHDSVNDIFLAYRSLALRDLDLASASVLSPFQEPPHVKNSSHCLMPSLCQAHGSKSIFSAGFHELMDTRLGKEISVAADHMLLIGRT
jgi:hypothetical protein